jgi:hypothetical protein
MEFACLAPGANGACCPPDQRFYCPATQKCYAAVSEAEAACPGSCVACGSPNDQNIGATSAGAAAGDIAPRDVHPLNAPNCPLPGGADLVFFTAAEALHTVSTDGTWTCYEAMDATSREYCFAAMAKAVGAALKLKPKPIISYDSGVTEAYLACMAGGATTADGGTPSDASSTNPNDPCDAAGTWTFDCPESPSSCGVCGYIPPGSITVTIPTTVAKNGGSFSVSGYSYNFDKSTCSVNFGASACGLSAGILHFSSSGAYDQVIYKCANDCSNCGPGRCPGTRQ